MSLLSKGFAAALAVAACNVSAQDKVLNLYSSRHYQTDEKLYEDFTRLTGIKINRLEAGEDALIERLRSEGARSPADVLVTVDAGRLSRAQEMGLLQPVKSAVLEARIPASLREPEGLWYGFSTRARVIAYNKSKVNAADIPSYHALADPRFRNRICVRSASHIYNLSLMGALIHHLGEAQAEAWARAVRVNLAREPKGGDTDQIKGVAQGECDLALINHYYYARLARSDKADEKAMIAQVGIVFPDQGGRGTHVNISGAGVAKHAPHREAAVKYLEYLASDPAQRYFADGNNEWPAVASVQADNPVLGSFGTYKRDALNVSVLGRNQPIAQKIFDRAGWK